MVAETAVRLTKFGRYSDRKRLPDESNKTKANEGPQAVTNDSNRATWWATFFVLMLAVYVAVGETVPWRNEFFYLVRLVRTFQPGYIPNDWTLSAGAPEHFAFNHLFGGLSHILSLEAIGWLGRVSFWAINLALLLRIAQRISLTPLSAVLTLGIWLGIGQSLVGLSWIFGTFEAKVVSYALLNLGLLLGLRGQSAWVGLLAGLAFTFHPSVGLWGGIGLAAVTLYSERNPRQLVIALSLAIVGALPGLIAVFPMLMSDQAATAADWELMVRVKMPHHLDPDSWPRLNKALIVLMFFFNLIHARKSGSSTWRKLVCFQIATLIPFVVGLVLRRMDAWESLGYFPFRLFPLYTPLFFGFALSDSLLRNKDVRIGRIATIMGILCLVALPSPFSGYVGALPSRIAPQSDVDPDLRACCEWIAQTLPPDAQGIAPPGLDREVWYFAERGLIVCSEFQSYHHLSEWRERVETLGGEMATVDFRRTKLREHFYELSDDKMDEVIRDYEPDFVITEQDYDWETGFDSGTFRVYLPKSGAREGSSTPLSN